jgi:hypothetical protein
MPHLWEDQTVPVIENALRAFKELAILGYQGQVSELIGFHDGDHASYMAGDAPTSSQDLALSNGGETNCYFQRYLPRNWDNGDGGMVPQYLPYLTRSTAIRATLFHRHPTLTLVDAAGAADKEQTERWADVMRRTRSTARDKRLQKRTELLNTAFSYVRWDGLGIALDVITPDNVEVYPDRDDPANLDKARLIRHRLPALLDTSEPFPERWLVWERIPGETAVLDEWYVYVMDNAWTILDNPFFPDNINPYKCFPYVVFNGEEQQDRIFQGLDDSLLTAQVGINIVATWFQDQMPDGIHVFSGVDKLPAKLPMGRNFAHGLEQGETYNWHAIPFDAAGMKTYLEMFLKLHASLQGLTPDVFSLESEAFTTALTGLAAQADRWDVQEVREDREPYWEYKLDARRAKIVTIHNHHSLPSERFDESLRLAVEWAQPEAPVDPQSQAQTRSTNIASGIASPVDYIMEDHGIADRGQALDRAREIAAEADELAPDIGGNNV